MSTASELFCSRRTRLGRSSADLELESSPDLRRHHRQQDRRYQSSRRHGFDGCLPLRRSLQSRMQEYGSPFTEREPFEVGEGSSRLGLVNDIIAGVSTQSNRSRTTCDERLPGAVLQARERLLQRLRGVAALDRSSRHDSRSPLNASQSGNTFNDDFGLLDVGDLEADVILGLSPRGSSMMTSILHSELHPYDPIPSKKPPGLTSEAINHLPVEIFNERGCGSLLTGGDIVSWDCSICLERFSTGNEFVQLPCGDRFHLTCLSSWVQIRGDCPCCRRSITLSFNA